MTIDIDAIEMRTLAATREPWHVEYLGDHGYPQRIANDAAVVVATTYEGTQPAGNAEFLAHARKDVPALVAEVRRLRTERDNALRLASLTAEQEAANAQIIVDTRQMANDANARLRALLLTALGREDDGTTALTQYVVELIADRNGWRKAANTPGR